MAQCVMVHIQGVPVYWLLDSGADISIIGGDLLISSRLTKSQEPTTRSPFKLNGRIDLDVAFEDKMLRTSIYVKTDAHDQLLLLEGVCRQLVTYHENVERWRAARKPMQYNPKPPIAEAKVLTVRVSLVQSVHLLPHQSAVVGVKFGPGCSPGETLLLESDVRNSMLELNICVTPQQGAFCSGSHIQRHRLLMCSRHRN